MPQMMIDVSVNKIAQIIQSMNNEEIETLYLLLTREPLAGYLRDIRS